MLSYFPKIFANKAIGFYFLLLLVVSVLFFQYALPLWLMMFGIVEVLMFFLGTNYCTKAWANISSKTFANRLFAVSFVIRVCYVIFSYFFYLEMTGIPFEFSAADVRFYDEMGRFGHSMISNGELDFLDRFQDYAGLLYSDAGYPIYLSFVYWLSGDSLIFTRILHALWLSLTAVLIYKLAARNFGESVGRMAGIFCMLMPNFIYYCGLHLKEPVMVFLTVLFVERADYLVRGDSVKLWPLILVLLSGIATFFFRTVLGAVLFASLGFALVFSSSKIVGWGKKILVSILVIFVLGIGVGGQIADEISMMLETDSSSTQEANMQWRSEREGGNAFAKYAGAAVFAPMIFTLPFPTVVNTEGQENQQMINGGNYVKNIMSFFTIFALFSLLFSGEWRKHILPLALMCSYILVLALSNFAHSERFHLPALPFVMMFAAYGVSLMQNKHKQWFSIWCIFIFVIGIAWSWFKLAGRGLL